MQDLTIHNNSPPHEMGQWIRRCLQTGIRLDQALLERMETSFGIAHPEDLRIESESSEAASFLELLFYPDIPTKTAFEQDWGDQRFSRETVNVLINQLERIPTTATILVAGRHKPLVLQVPETAVASFVKRLKIDWQPPAELPTALEQWRRHPHFFSLKARLRHCRAQWHSNQIELVLQLITNIPAAADDFHSCLAFVLTLLPELEPQTDPFDFLIAKKNHYFQSLCKAEAFERQRQSSNMEILMLQGARAAHGSIAQWQRQMRRIDRICEALFGRTHYFNRPTNHERPMRTGREVSNAIRDLWSEEDL